MKDFIINKATTIGNQLISRIAHQDEKALEELYNAYSKILFSLIIAIIKARDEAGDVLQEVFLHVWKRASSFDQEKGNVYGWLTTLARNLSIDKLRSRRFKEDSLNIHYLNPDIFMKEFEESQLDHMINSERHILMKNALTQIPPDQKEVIILAYFEGYTQSEIAELLNIPLGTVKTRIRNGILNLQQLVPGDI